MARSDSSGELGRQRPQSGAVLRSSTLPRRCLGCPAGRRGRCPATCRQTFLCLDCSASTSAAPSRLRQRASDPPRFDPARTERPPPARTAMGPCRWQRAHPSKTSPEEVVSEINSRRVALRRRSVGSPPPGARRPRTVHRSLLEQPS